MPQTDGIKYRTPPKKPVVGVGISATSYGEVVDSVAGWIEERRDWARQPEDRPAPPGRYICVTSVHGVISSFRDSGIRRILNEADIATPDGTPLVWALRSFGVSGQTRVYGPNLMLAACERAAQRGYRIFLYGGHDDVLDLLERRLGSRFPGLCIAGRFSPPFRPLTEQESAQVVRLIRECDADLVFVGLSTPKQDRWMAQHHALLPGVVMVGVGAAFNFHAGKVKQAPPWMQRSGLEWLFRLLAEPKRLWKRYLLVTPLFLPLWGMQKLGILRYPEPDQRR